MRTDYWTDNRQTEALDMAIKSLKQYLCEDAVSRQAVLEQINCWIGSGEYRYTNATDYLNKRIKALPPVRPQEQTGKWKFVCQHWRKCSECGFSHKFAEDWKYCPNCGARMESEE